MKHVWLAVVCLCLGALSSVHAQAPTIKSFKPASGPVGTRVNMAGENLINTTGVIFGGGVPATQGAFADTGVSAVVPPGAQTGPITVLGSAGNVTTKDAFVVTATPTPAPTPTPTPTPAPTVDPVPVIISPTTADATRHQPFTYQIKADRPVSSYAADNLPAGLRVDPATGVISGAPVDSGSFGINISATDADGTGTGTLSLTVANDAPEVTVSVSPPKIKANGADTAKFVFTLSRPVSSDTLVQFQPFGGMDVVFGKKLARGYVIIPAGKTRKSIAFQATVSGTFLLGEGRKEVFYLTLDHTATGPTPSVRSRPRRSRFIPPEATDDDAPATRFRARHLPGRPL